MNNANYNANDTMDTVDRVLAGLRDIEAPAGIERRILSSLQQPATANTSSARSSITSPLLWLAATAATIVAVTIWWNASKRPTHDLAIHPPITAMPSAAAPQQADVTVSASRARKAQHAAVATQTAKNSQPEPITRPVAAATSDTLAASHPAPPLPLTEQEQLLLRILHKGDPIELASLNNDFRDRQPIRDAEDFQRFFKPPTAPHSAEATVDDQTAQQNQPDIEAQPAPEPEPNDIPQQ